VAVKIKEIHELAKKSKGKMVQDLIAAVSNVQPKLHINVSKTSE
jgi:hypothetical protein